MKLALFLAVVAMAALVWLTDKVTPEGERTVYTVRCEGGDWNGLRCTGKLAAAERYRFRALKNRHEVLFWTLGSSEPSDKYVACTIRNRDNWVCPVGANQKPTIAYEMANGWPRAGANPATAPFHAVRKWKWMLIDGGFGVFRDADV